jgi:hypothetical protein
MTRKKVLKNETLTLEGQKAAMWVKCLRNVNPPVSSVIELDILRSIFFSRPGSHASFF